MLGLDHLGAVGAEEALGAERLGLVPQLGVHVDRVQKGDHVGVLGESVAVECDFAGRILRNIRFCWGVLKRIIKRKFVKLILTYLLREWFP